MNTLILSSSNRNFPLDLQEVLAKAGTPCTRLGSLNEFISTPLRSRPFFTVLEVGNKEDIDRALIAYEWAEKVQPQAPARFLLLVGSRHISLADKASRFGGVEIAQLPLPQKNLLFKIDLQLKLLEKEAQRPPREAEGFLAEFTGPAKERVLVMRGPRKGSWESESPHGKVRWRWVRAEAGKKEDLTWTVQSLQAPVFDEKENLWKVQDPGAELSCRKDGELLFVAREEGFASSQESRASPTASGPSRISPEEGKRASAADESRTRQEEDTPSTALNPAAEAAAPSAPPSRQEKPAEAQPEEAPGSAAPSSSSAAQAPASKDYVQPWNLRRPAAPEPKESRENSGGQERAPAPTAALKADPAEKTARPAAVSVPAQKESSAPAGGSQSGSSVPSGERHSVSSGESRASSGPAQLSPEAVVHSSSGESVSSLRSQLGREEEGVPSLQPSSTAPSLTGKRGKVGAAAEEALGVSSPSSAPSGTSAPRQQRTEIPVAERPAPGRAKDPAPAGDGREQPSAAGSSAAPAESRSSSPETAAQTPEREGKNREDLETESPRARPEPASPPAPSTLSPVYSPQEMETRISGETPRSSPTVSESGQKGSEGRLEVRLYSTPAPSEERTQVSGPSRENEDPEHFLKMRHFLTLSLEELHDRNSSWYPVEGYRIYLSAQHRYYGFQAVEEVLPLWIYEGELAPEFLDLKKAWKFYDRRPVLYGSKAELPPAVLAYLMKSAGEKAAAVGEAAPSTNEAPRESSAEAGLGRPEEAEERAPSKPPAEPEEEGNLFVRLVRKVFGKD